MKKFFANLGVYFWLTVGLIGTVLVLFTKGLLTRGSVPRKPGELLPPPPKKIIKKIREAEVNAEVVRRNVEITTTEQKAKLKKIAEVEDGAEMREELASFLDSL